MLIDHCFLDVLLSLLQSLEKVLIKNAFLLIILFRLLLFVLSLSLELVEIVVELSLGLEDFLSALSESRCTFGSLSRTRLLWLRLPCIAVVI